MTSKEKLIEFLKSANVEYIESSKLDFIMVRTYVTEYYFDLDGSFDSMYNS